MATETYGTPSFFNQRVHQCAQNQTTPIGKHDLGRGEQHLHSSRLGLAMDDSHDGGVEHRGTALLGVGNAHDVWQHT